MDWKHLVRVMPDDKWIAIMTIVPYFLLVLFHWRRASWPAVIVSESSYPNILLSHKVWTPWSRPVAGRTPVYVMGVLYPALLSCFRWVLRSSLRATLVMNLVLSFAANLVFYRLASVLRFVGSPLLSTGVFAMFPLRALYLRHIGNEFNLLVVLLGLALLAHKKRWRTAWVFQALLPLVSPLGLAVSAGILLSALPHARQAAVGFALSLGAMCGVHRLYGGDALGLWKFLRGQGMYPFRTLFAKTKSISDLREGHSIYGSLLPPLVGTACLSALDARVGLPLVCGLVWAAMHRGNQFFDLLAPVEALALLGFESLFATPRFRRALWVLGPFGGGVALFLVSRLMDNPGLRQLKTGQIPRDL